MAEKHSLGTRLAPAGCWTCKDRRVRCDRALPGCLNCARVRRQCQGYGMRLSWPKDNDPKRAVVGKQPPRRNNQDKFPRLHIIHASFGDMEMHKFWLDLGTYESKKLPDRARYLPDQLQTPHPSSLKSFPLYGREAELVHYFASTAFASLVIFNQDVAKFRDMLIQMALSDGTLASQAVLFALLAVSSQSRDGLQSRAVQLKTSAISALAKSAKTGPLGTREAAQHVAAGMLLCSFEIQTSSETSGQWLWYIRGVKDIIKAHNLDSQANDGFVADLLDWVYYHDVIAQFSILHWRHGPVETVFAKQLDTKGAERSPVAKRQEITNSPWASNRILQFLSEIFHVLLQAFEQRDAIGNIVGSLNMLEGKASTVVEISERYEIALTDSAEAKENATYMIQLYQMAAMIYFARVSESVSGKLRNMKPLLDSAFSLVCRMRTCELQFPLLIMGSEARTDEQRIMILDLVRRTETTTYGRNIDCLRQSLGALWIQEDLVADQESAPNYMDRLSAIISTTRFIPSLV